MPTSLGAVEIDDHVLFRVRSTSALPAEKRAAAIVGGIEMRAADANVSAETVRPIEFESGTGIFVGNQLVLLVLDADARLGSWDWIPGPSSLASSTALAANDGEIAF